MSTGLFSDEEDGYNLEETKYKLKLGDEEPEGGEEAIDGLEDMGVDDLDADIDIDAEDGSNDKPFDDEPFDAGVEADEDENPEKFIQQLAGKLGQSLRKYTENQGQPDFDLEKFAINSVISATHTAEMDNEDQKDIISKIKESGKGEVDTGDVDTGDEDGGVNVDPEGGEGDFNIDDEEVQEESTVNSDGIEKFYDATVVRKSDGLKGKVVRFDNGKLKVKITDGTNIGKIFLAYPEEVEIIKDVNFNLGENKNVVSNLSKTNMNKSLDSNINFSNFVRKDNILKRLKEHHDMNYKDYGKYDRDEYMLDGPDISEAPETKPAPTKPTTKPDVKPSRRQKPWRPNKQPKVNPKADSGEGLIMSEGEGSNGRIVKKKYIDGSRAILTVSLDDNEVDMTFNKTDELLTKPETYGEPWVYAFKSTDSPDDKTYQVGVEFYGHPETHLEVGDIHDEYIEKV